MFRTSSFFDLSSFAEHSLFEGTDYVWDALKKLKSFMDAREYPGISASVEDSVPLCRSLVLAGNKSYDISEVRVEMGDATKGLLKIYKDGELIRGASLIMAGAVLCGNRIKIGKGVLIEAGALIKSPTILGDYNEVRQGAYIRGYCLTGCRCVIGHATEVKHSIFLNDAKAGHFAYLGDTILGNNVNLGAGTKMANLRFTGGAVPIKTPKGLIDSGLRKMGAILGDHAQTGCNSVTNPGTLLGRKSIILPNVTAPSGYHPDSTLIK